MHVMTQIFLGVKYYVARKKNTNKNVFFLIFSDLEKLIIFLLAHFDIYVRCNKWTFLGGILLFRTLNRDNLEVI